MRILKNMKSFIYGRFLYSLKSSSDFVNFSSYLGTYFPDPGPFFLSSRLYFLAIFNYYKYNNRLNLNKY